MPPATEEFTPLLPAATPGGGAPPSFRLTVLAADAAQAHPFQSFPGMPPAPSTASPRCPASGRPEVILLRDGEVITGIRIHCTCGEVITLDCLYEFPSDQ